MRPGEGLALPQTPGLPRRGGAAASEPKPPLASPYSGSVTAPASSSGENGFHAISQRWPSGSAT